VEWRTGQIGDRALCTKCGHPRMAHMGHPCYCGCTGSTASSLVLKRSPSSRPKPAPMSTRISKPKPRPQAPSFDPSPVGRLLEFIKWNMTIAESETFLRLVAEAHGARYVPTQTPGRRSEGSSRRGSRSLTPRDTCENSNVESRRARSCCVSRSPSTEGPRSLPRDLQSEQNSPSRWRFCPLSPLTFRFRVEPSS
jgi:hypothetical protein